MYSNPGYSNPGPRADARAAYLGNSVATASPAQLLIMLYERLVLDVRRGLEAQEQHRVGEAHQHLVHAQEIVLELRSSLDTDAWEGGPALASIYDFLHLQLIRANVKKDAELTRGCLALVEDLCATWRQAALAAAQAA
ncbi:flagellar export chaperone FliS [Nocardioides bruguierae]|uniref:Flagellar export chaperone FliS n=1 Tax=Nocardioides bruguierae TaxID=2945102 RepID=A0A9X2DB90_9ACTN|nr:flagellar export chaperone FliS [Nocardioides bruguierae]MCL8027709.1 flagellar export chaperone FliS [Nocardioides bruguierae]MCM0622576.1 flagellar export chaperone FliS [Nocardioides bruguierae]